MLTSLKPGTSPYFLARIFSDTSNTPRQRIGGCSVSSRVAARQRTGITEALHEACHRLQARVAEPVAPSPSRCEMWAIEQPELPLDPSRRCQPHARTAKDHPRPHTLKSA